VQIKKGSPNDDPFFYYKFFMFYGCTRIPAIGHVTPLLAAMAAPAIGTALAFPAPFTIAGFEPAAAVTVIVLPLILVFVPVLSVVSFSATI
jgi:hypothetical protein